jgi:protein-disulfide isomerase
MKKYLQLSCAAALSLALVLPLTAQQQNGGISSKQADDIITELRQMKVLLQQQAALLQVLAQKGAQPQPEPPPTRAKLNLEGFQMLGVKSAPLTMVEFTDYQCPFCQRFHTTSFGELKKNYIDTGKLRFYSRDLPLDFHPNAMRAAQAARCAIEQGKYWQIRDIMGANPDKLDLEHLVGFAAELKMDTDAFRACVTSEKYKNAVQSDVVEAMKIGANGTPTFVVGKSTPEGVDGEVMVGAMPFQMFDEKLKSLEK